MNNQWETLGARVKRHAQIPLKKKLEWLRQMLELGDRNQFKLRKKVRLIVR